MKMEGGQASRRSLARSLFDETAKVKQGCEEKANPRKEISEEKFLSDALEEMPGSRRWHVRAKACLESVDRQRRGRSNTPNYRPFD